MRITVDVFGDRQLDRELLRWSNAITDMAPAFIALADDFYGIETRQFDSEGANSGGWAPLKPSTVSRRLARGYGAGPILDASGRLRNSLTRPGAPYAVRTITPHELVIGTSDPIAVFHQRGTRRMPRRRPVEFTAVDRARWVRTMQRHLAAGGTRRAA